MFLLRLELTPEQELIEKRIEIHMEPLPSYVKEYVLAKKRAGMSSDTLLQYIYRFEHFFNWLLTEGIVKVNKIADIPYKELEVLKKSTVEFYIDHLKNENIAKDSSKVQYRGKSVVDLSIHALKSLFNYLTTETEDEETGECYFDRNVMKKIKTEKDKESASYRARQISSKILNGEEIQDYLYFIEHEYHETLENNKQKADFKRNFERDLAINSIILGSGVRVGEVAKMKLKDINFRKKYINVIRKGNKPDSVPVMDDALADLKRYLDVRLERYPNAKECDYVFVTNYRKKDSDKSVIPLSRRSIQNIVDKYTAAFNGSEKGMSPHKLRHSFAADYLRNGGNIVLLRDQLGHNDIKTTSLYTNLANKDSEMVLQRMEQNRKSRDK